MKFYLRVLGYLDLFGTIHKTGSFLGFWYDSSLGSLLFL